MNSKGKSSKQVSSIQPKIKISSAPDYSDFKDLQIKAKIQPRKNIRKSSSKHFGNASQERNKQEQSDSQSRSRSRVRSGERPNSMGKMAP